MLEILVEVLGELVVQVLAELPVRGIVRSLAKSFRRAPNPWFAAVGYAILGAAIGGLSLLVIPAHLTPPGWRIVNLIATPLAVGALMATLGRWRARRGDPTFRIDRFSYGYGFALAMAMARFSFAE